MTQLFSDFPLFFSYTGNTPVVQLHTDRLCSTAPSNVGH